MTVPGATHTGAPVEPPGDPVFGGPRGRSRRRPSRRQMAVGAAVVVAAGGASLGTWLGTRPSPASAAGSPISVSTETVAVTTGTMKQTVAASGTLAPAQAADLAFAVSGTVTAVDVATGQVVKTGQILATIDPTALADIVAGDQASLTAAQDRLATDQADAAPTSQIDSDRAAVTSAETQLASAQSNLSDATLRATFNGTVAAVDLAVGDQVSGGGSGGGGSGGGGSGGGAVGSSSANGSSSSGSSGSGVTVISTGSYTVSTSVDDTEIGQVKVGDQAVITLSGTTGSSNVVYGTVQSVSLIASSSNSAVATFPVVVAVTGSPSGLYAGSSASVSIVVRQLDDVVEVPTAAISYPSGSPTVTKVVGGKDVTQPVTTGISASGETQITRGLEPGDKVVERVVRFKAPSGSGARTLFGGAGAGRAGGGGGFAGFPGGGRFGGGGGGFARTGGGGFGG